MGGPRNQSERRENEKLVVEEDQEMEVDVEGLDENQISEYVRGQSQSRFAMVHRKFAEGKKWYAQVMRPAHGRCKRAEPVPLLHGAS